MMSWEGFNDVEAQRTVVRALRLQAGITAVAGLLVWWKFSWADASLLLVGALVSGSGLWEWMRMMTAIMARMNAGAKPRPMGRVLSGFLLRLAVVFALAYVSLKFLDGSVYALAAGLGTGVIALTFEGLRLVRAWTV